MVGTPAHFVSTTAPSAHTPENLVDEVHRLGTCGISRQGLASSKHFSVWSSPAPLRPLYPRSWSLPMFSSLNRKLLLRTSGMLRRMLGTHWTQQSYLKKSYCHSLPLHTATKKHCPNLFYPKNPRLLRQINLQTNDLYLLNLLLALLYHLSLKDPLHHQSPSYFSPNPLLPSQRSPSSEHRFKARLHLQ